MNWDFFEDVADLTAEQREDVLRDADYNLSGPFRKLFLSAPSRKDLDAIRKSVFDHKSRNHP